jgi:hypothetical protein
VVVEIGAELSERLTDERSLQRPDVGRRAALRHHEERPRAPRADHRNRGEAIAPVPAPRVIGVSPKLKPASITV